MANKNLVKRALSVTAHLQPTSSQSAAEANAHAAAPDAKPPSDSPLHRHSRPETELATSQGSPAAPRTGPGSMLAFMTEQSEVHKEVVSLRQQLTDFQGAEVARRLNAKDVVASKWANRDASHFETEEFARLKHEIASSGGNIQPIKVRPLAEAGPNDAHWEIVYGHRRHRACLELGLPVLALIQREMKDAELFVEMERENRERADLSAWEQGVMYMRALELGLFPSAKQLANAIDRDMSNISRAMALAKLPADVVRAFGSPLNLQFRWATPLREAHQRDPEELLRRARELSSGNPKFTPAEVFAALVHQPTASSPKRGDATDWRAANGERFACMSVDRKGKVVLSFDRPLEEAQRKRLAKLVEAFLGEASNQSH